MPLLREVWVWPPSGFPDRPWVDDPDDDAFAKMSRARRALPPFQCRRDTPGALSAGG